VDGIGSRSCAVAAFGINCVDPLAYAMVRKRSLVSLMRLACSRFQSVINGHED
jgi:hypothetical protein